MLESKFAIAFSDYIGLHRLRQIDTRHIPRHVLQDLLLVLEMVRMMPWEAIIAYQLRANRRSRRPNDLLPGTEHGVGIGQAQKARDDTELHPDRNQRQQESLQFLWLRWANRNAPFLHL